MIEHFHALEENNQLSKLMRVVRRLSICPLMLVLSYLNRYREEYVIYDIVFQQNAPSVVNSQHGLCTESDAQSK